MSTPERDPPALPAELRLANGHTPKPTHVLEVPSQGPTPGVSTVPARHPSAPTLPDGDPVSMALLIQQMANALFQGPISSGPLVSETQPAAGSPGLSDAVLPAASAFNSDASGAPARPAGVPDEGAGRSVDPRPLEPDSTAGPSHARETTSAAKPLPTASQNVVAARRPDGASPRPLAPQQPFHGEPKPDSVPGTEGLSPKLVDRSFQPTGATELPAPFHTPVDLSSVLVGAGAFGMEAPATPAASGSAVDAPAPIVNQAAPEAFTPRFSDAYELSPTGHGYRHASPTLFDPHALKREFPILQQTVHGKPLVWLDNAATTQKPRAVIDRLSRFYEEENSNIHRAAHTLAARATDAYEGARSTVRRFINAPSTRDLIFVRGTTEGINLVAKSWGARNVQAGDEIVISWLEHHANIVPWQQLANEKGATLRVAPVDDRGQIILEAYERLLSPKTRLVAFTQVSNALGTITPAKEMVKLARRHGAKVLVDGAQAVSHLRVDVQDLDCDFFVFSGHKVFGPTGIGVVFARSELMDATPPWQGGGNMIQDVTFERTVFHPSPARFEAGTGNIADAVGLGAALDWLTRVGLETVGQYEHQLLEYATEQVLTVPGLTLYGTAADKAGVLSFTLEGQPTEQMSALLDRDGIAVRSGHHCAQPILRRFGVEATVRASFAPYNTVEDVDTLVASLRRLQEGR